MTSPDAAGKSGAESQKVARNRLRFELGGLAFALKCGSTPEEYARHFFSEGARGWLKGDSPSPAEYLRKEAEAFRLLYPWAEFEIKEAGNSGAELVFTNGCLGGWGSYPWKTASEFGLQKEDICRYCHEAFSIWAAQLGLKADIGPAGPDTCRLKVSI